MNDAKPPECCIQTDASGTWGCEGIFKQHWLQLSWPTEWSTTGIMAKELVPIFISCSIWGPLLAGHRVLCQCDNQSLVISINKGYSRDPLVMHLLRYLWLFFLAVYDIKVRAEHITGVSNCAADMLSRNYLTEFFLSFSPVVPSTVCNPATTHRNYVTKRARLDLPHLQVALQEYFANGAARSTWRTYAVVQRRYLTFCAAARRQAVPTTETSLMLFATDLATSGLAYTSIKVYLAAVRHLHVTKGKHSQFTAQLTPRLQQVLKGIKKAQAVSRQPATRRPITLTILKGIRATLLSQPRRFSNIMTWAACCLAFFGLRSSEFTVPSQYEYDGSVHLSVRDISIDSRSAPRMIRVRIKQSKTDPFLQGVDIYLGRTDTDICPVKAILPYLAIRGNRPGPLFIQEDGKCSRGKCSAL